MDRCDGLSGSASLEAEREGGMEMKREGGREMKREGGREMKRDRLHCIWGQMMCQIKAVKELLNFLHKERVGFSLFTISRPRRKS